MKKIADNIAIEILVKDYLELNSSYKVAKKHDVSATAVKRLLKEAGVLRTQSNAATIRNNSHDCFGTYERTEAQKNKLSQVASERTGNKNPFYGKKHSLETKKIVSEKAKTRTGERNSNYKHGKNLRRPRDFKNSELKPLRSFTYNRDKHTCIYCKKVGGHLHAHHKIPYWVKPEAFLDKDNLVTVCTECHFKKAHKGNWSLFDQNLIDESLIVKYSLDRERLNELADYKNLKR